MSKTWTTSSFLLQKARSLPFHHVSSYLLPTTATTTVHPFYFKTHLPTTPVCYFTLDATSTSNATNSSTFTTNPAISNSTTLSSSSLPPTLFNETKTNLPTETPTHGQKDESSSSESLNELKHRFLSKALTLVPSMSFTQQALHQALKELNLPLTYMGLVPHGPKDLIEFLLQQGLIQLRLEYDAYIKSFSSNPNASIGMTKTVMHLTEKRLQFMEPYIHQWPQALQYLASHPRYFSFSLEHLQSLVDEIWYLAGDQSVDFNYYTKRTLLAGIYSSSELFMTTDTSPHFEHTYQFMRNRFDNTKHVSQFMKGVQSRCSFGMNSILGVLRSRG